MLPAPIRAELDRLIVEPAFSGYQALAEWLQARGYKISDDSVQRYGVCLREQLDDIKLAPDQVRALAAAGKRARDSADDLTTITVQQILQQILAILLQAPQPCGLFGRADTSSNAAGSGNAGDSGETRG